jgi:hypothetical protein
MKKFVLLVVLFPLLTLAMENNNEDYINTYLPDSSLIKQRHNSEKPGTVFFGLFNSEVREGCDYLQSIFARVGKNEKPSFLFRLIFASGGSGLMDSEEVAEAVDFHRNNCCIENAINSILSDQKGEIKRREFSLIWAGIKEMQKKYKNPEPASGSSNCSSLHAHDYY